MASGYASKLIWTLNDTGPSPIIVSAEFSSNSIYVKDKFAKHCVSYTHNKKKDGEKNMNLYEKKYLKAI